MPTPPNTAAPVIGVCTASAVEVVENLRRELARGREDQRPRRAPRLADQLVKDRQQERRRLAAAGLRAGEDVLPCSAGGMASAWIGVGRMKPSSLMPLSSEG